MTSRKPFKFATQSEKPGLSSSISLETVAPEALQFEKINKNEPNSQTNSVFWLVAVGIHNLRGYQSIWGPWGYFGLQEGVKNLKKPQKTTKKVKKLKKHVRINNQGPFFG